MTTLQEMFYKVTSASEHDLMMRSVAPLSDYFGINNFYYVRVTTSGYYSALGTHVPWHEYFCENITNIGKSPFLRHPDLVRPGISLLKNTTDSRIKESLSIAWKKYGVNFTINIMKKIPEGIEAFGFGTNINHPDAEAHQLSNLLLLDEFIDHFCEKNKKLIRLAHENQVEITSILDVGDDNISDNYVISKNKRLLLEHLGFGAIFLLTSREIDVLKFMASGFPANYIAQQLHLSSRTVENHIANIKSKLDCNSKVNLIKMAKKLILVIDHL